jgi:hypothetical protein
MSFRRHMGSTSGNRDHNIGSSLNRPAIHMMDDSGSPVACDIDESYGLSDNGSTKRLKKSSTWYPHGPKTMDEVLSFTRDAVIDLTESMRANGKHNVANRLKEFPDLNIVATSCYSGVGSAESALAEFRETCCDLRPDQAPRGSLVFYSVCDNGCLQQRVLANSTHTILHRFKDVLGRLPSGCRAELEDIQTEKITVYKHLCKERIAGTVDDDGFEKEKRRLGEALVSEITEYLKTVVFNDTDYCSVCEG